MVLDLSLLKWSLLTDKKYSYEKYCWQQYTLTEKRELFLDRLKSAIWQKKSHQRSLLIINIAICISILYLPFFIVVTICEAWIWSSLVFCRITMSNSAEQKGSNFNIEFWIMEKPEQIEFCISFRETGQRGINILKSKECNDHKRGRLEKFLSNHMQCKEIKADTRKVLQGQHNQSFNAHSIKRSIFIYNFPSWTINRTWFCVSLFPISFKYLILRVSCIGYYGQQCILYFSNHLCFTLLHNAK